MTLSLSILADPVRRIFEWAKRVLGDVTRKIGASRISLDGEIQVSGVSKEDGRARDRLNRMAFGGIRS
jgi:hypothetical protein